MSADDNRPEPLQRWPHITALLANAGHITIGYVASIEGAAVAADQHTLLATVVRRPGEPLDELLQRLDHAVHRALNEGVYTNEIQDGRLILATPKVKRRKK